jgi:hypothetical protein
LADAPAHVLAAGAGVQLGRQWGVDVRADGAAQLWLLQERRFDKPSDALPYAHYRVGGRLIDVAAALEATWR